MQKTTDIAKTYLFSILLIFSLLAGGFFGYFYPEIALKLKPVGEIFLNLIFTTIVPLIFFSVSAAVSRLGSWKKLGRIFGLMCLIFLITGLIAAFLSLLVVQLFPLGAEHAFSLSNTLNPTEINIAEKIAGVFTVPEFMQLFSHHHMLALIFFSLLVGIAASNHSTKDISFSTFLIAGEAVFMKVFSYIMYLAPLGFFAYFGSIISELGPKILENYARISILYYAFGSLYFLFIYTWYAYWANNKAGVKLFWSNIFLPASTALATCSSAASIPANLTALQRMKVTAEVYETVIPLGTVLHKDGSTIGGIFKIAFLFSIFHLDFTSMSVLAIAVGMGMLVGTVMGAIPSGGMLGELLILSVYGFPSSALIIIAAISVIIDPLATLLNVTGNTAATLLVNRYISHENKKAG